MGIKPGQNISRVELWPLHLSQFQKDRENVPFAWGSNDCVLLAADLVQRLTGIDFAADVRGTYSDETAARALLDERGGIEAVITAAFGFEPTDNPLRAMRGDVVLVVAELDGSLAAGFVDDSGRRICVISPKGKMGRLPLTAAKKIWSY